MTKENPTDREMLIQILRNFYNDNSLDAETENNILNFLEELNFDIRYI